MFATVCCLWLVPAVRSLFFPFFIQDGRYLPYVLNECIWTTPHNHNHGYICEITAVGISGKQIIVTAMCLWLLSHFDIKYIRAKQWSGFSFTLYWDIFLAFPHIGLGARLRYIGSTRYFETYNLFEMILLFSWSSFYLFCPKVSANCYKSLLFIKLCSQFCPFFFEIALHNELFRMYVEMAITKSCTLSFCRTACHKSKVLRAWAWSCHSG